MCTCCLCRPGEGVRSPWTRGTHSCESPCGAGNRTWVLCKNSKHWVTSPVPFQTVLNETRGSIFKWKTLKKKKRKRKVLILEEPGSLLVEAWRGMACTYYSSLVLNLICAFSQLGPVHLCFLEWWLGLVKQLVLVSFWGISPFPLPAPTEQADANAPVGAAVVVVLLPALGLEDESCWQA